LRSAAMAHPLLSSLPSSLFPSPPPCICEAQGAEGLCRPRARSVAPVTPRRPVGKKDLT
jgi:hypothetical protein